MGECVRNMASKFHTKLIYPRVEVTWADANSTETGWMQATAIPEKLLTDDSYSIGYLIRKTKVELVLAMNWNGKESFADLMVIPSVLVTRIRKL